MPVTTRDWPCGLGWPETSSRLAGKFSHMESVTHPRTRTAQAVEAAAPAAGRGVGMAAHFAFKAWRAISP